MVVLEDFKQEKIPLVIYFASNLHGLVAEKIEVVKVEGLARKAMEELIKGPKEGSGLLLTLPSGTQLRDINIKDGTCIVDFSKELKEKHPGGVIGSCLRYIR